LGKGKVTDVRIVPAISAIGKKTTHMLAIEVAEIEKEKMKAHYRWLWLSGRHME